MKEYGQVIVRNFYKIFAILYLLFFIAYLLGSPTSAYLTDKKTYYGTLSTEDQFEEDELEKDVDVTNFENEDQLEMPIEQDDKIQTELDEDKTGEIKSLESETKKSEEIEQTKKVEDEKIKENINHDLDSENESEN